MGAVCAQLSVVIARLDQLQHQARGRTLVPQNLPRAAEILRLAGLDHRAKGLGFHPAEDQHLAAFGIGRSAGHAPVWTGFRREPGAFLDPFDALPFLELHVCVHRRVCPLVLRYCIT